MQPIDSENSQSSYLWWILLMVTFLALLLPHTDTSAMVNSKHLVKTLVVSGTLEIVDSDQRVAGIEVRINGQTSLSTDGGRYQATIAKADVYHMAFSRDDLFQTVQTFAHSELEKSASSGMEIPTIELVEKKPGRVELIFGGDVMMGRRYIRPRWNEPQLIHGTTRKEDMEKLIQHMRPYFESADYGAVNLETVLSVDDPGAHAPKGVVFYTDPQILEALKTMGVDYVSLGNNHIYDYLDKGLDATVAALDRSGIGFSGAGTNEQEALLPYQTTIKDQPYAMLGYVGWKGRVTPNQIAEENKAGAALGTTANIIASVKQAGQAGGTTVVQYHGSREYSEAPTEITEKRLKAAVDAGADLVVGHHPHVAHGLELYKGKLIAYSLGNFIFDQFIYEAQAAYALKVWMDGDRFYRAEIIPVHLRAYRPVPAMAGVRRHILQRVFHLSAKRGTFLTLSGGHGVITQNSGVRKAEREYDLSQAPASRSTGTLDFALTQNAPIRVAAQENLILGRDLLFRGDFESAALLDINSRTWETSNGQAELIRDSKNGQFSKLIKGSADCSGTQFGLKTFLRVLDQEKYSFSGWVKATGKTKISAQIQQRPQGMNRYKALANAPYQPVGFQEIDDEGWTKFEFDFMPKKSTKGKVLPMRVMLSFQPATMQCDRLEYQLDDVSLVGWENDKNMFERSLPSRNTHFKILDTH